MKKIGIIYMCTGSYKIFWRNFYESSEKYLLENCEKHYFVFTDAEEIEYESINDRIHRTYIEHREWPFVTLLRYSTIIEHMDLLQDMDYLFFFNANIEFIKDVNESELLPQNDELVVVRWITPETTNLNNVFEKNPKSKAYIPDGEGVYYVAGGLNGGLRETYLKMAHECSLNIQHDLENGLIATWHDESHLNKYVLDHPRVKLLDKTIFLATTETVKKETKVFLLNKNVFFENGHVFLRSGMSYTENPKYRENLIVYGTGQIAEKWYQKFKDKVTIKYFVCSNPDMDYFHGIEVKKADKEIVKQGFVILALYNGYSYAYAFMQECGLKEYKDFVKSEEYIL